MTRSLIFRILITILLFPAFAGLAEETKDGMTVSGFIKDGSTGELLPGATIYVVDLGKGSASNAYGFYSLTLPAGRHELSYSFIGYTDLNIRLDLSRDTTLNIELLPSAQSLDEVEVLGEAVNENVNSSQMSVNTITSKTIKDIPAFMGEVDLIKALQLLPGVKFVAEGTSGFSVRGSSPDQNLVLLDEATIYNAGHLLGFFSVFNNDAVTSVELYKGDLPAQYGGRIASLVDVRMKEGNSRQFHGNGGIGLISSRLTLEGPILKDKISYMIAGRRTYADLFLKLSRDENLRDNQLYFYDLNAKVNWTINHKNRVYLSGYFGRDVFRGGIFGMNWGNSTGSVRWNHIFNDKLFSNFTLIASNFNYSLGIPEGNEQAFRWQSNMRDYTFKGDFTWFANTNNSISFGLASTYHDFFPGTLEGLGAETPFGKYSIPNSYALESAVYISNEQKIGNLLTLKYGFRFSIFNNMGPGTQYFYDTEGVPVDSTIYNSRSFYNTYTGIEPRVGIVFKLTEVSSVKASYARNYQYLQQASNSTAGSPFNIWFMASPNVLPQVGDQVAAGYYHNFMEGMIETSGEVYYKMINDAVDFRDHADLLLNKYLEGEVLTGKGFGYGIELMVRKTRGKWTGWISYTWSRSFNQIEGINNGDPYPAHYDRPNDLSLTASYQVSPTITLGLNWLYLTGQPVTFPVGKYEYMNDIVPVYSERNSYRFPDYHRMDLSFTWTEKKKPNKRWRSEINVSVYNAYNRKNPWVINFQEDPNMPNTTYAEMTYLFGIIPSVTYNFSF